jgi:glycosyltransferase involved in cell wall biosynthesis
MKVLQVIPSLAVRTGGPPVAVVESSLALQKCGVETTIFATDMAEAASASRHARATAADLPQGAADVDLRLFPARHPYRLAFAPELSETLAAEASSFDVIHIHSLFLYPQFAAYRQASRRSVPYIVSPRGSLDPYLRKRGRAVKALASVLWQRRLLDGAAALHLTSDEEARLVADIAPRIPRCVIPNGIRWQEYQRLPSGDEFRRCFLGGSREPVVMYLGRMSHKKGIDALVRAFAIVVRNGVSCRLAIVGPDDEGLTPRLVALAAAEGISDRVVFPGMLQGDGKLGALAAASVWALPSHSENFGNAVLEAMAAGVPVVISPAVNIAREIQDAAAGVVADLTPEAFALSIEALLRDPGGREQLGVRAREFAAGYDWALVGPQLAAMYESVLRRN